MFTTRALVVAVGVSLLASPAALASKYPYSERPVTVPDPKDAAAGLYKLDPAHTSVTMRISHMGLSNYTIRFNGFQGQYQYDPANPTASRVVVTIDPKSIDTGNPVFNKTIANDFFEAARYPAITFTANAVRAIGTHGAVDGELDLHGVKRPLSLEVAYHGYKPNEEPHRMGFSATTSLKRSDFGVDPYEPIEGDQVDVIIEAEFIRAQV